MRLNKLSTLWPPFTGLSHVPTFVPGAEYVMSADRLHYEASADRLHYEASADRLHFVAEEE